MPLICAPMATSRLHRSTISGSRAALPIRLVPVARTAAITAFSVAPTDTTGKAKSPPGKPPSGARAFTYPCVTSISAPNASSAFR